MKSKSKSIRDIQADLVSRENALNGKYKACQCGLSDAEVCRQKDSVYLEGLRMKADLLDDLILKNEKEGKDTKNLQVLKKLGEEINAIFHPICKTELLGSIIGSYLSFLLFYGVAIGVWCFVFKKSFLGFFICGAVLGILVCSVFSLPVIMIRRSKERIKEAEIVLGYLWTKLAIVIGIVGFITLAIRAIFFR